MPFHPLTSYQSYADEQLVAALRNGDRAAYAEIYDRYWQVLYRLAYQKIRSKETAEELVQDLFVSLWTKRDGATIRVLRPYLLTALRFSIIDYIESRLVHERFIDYYESFLAQRSENPADDLALQDLTEAIEKSLRTLPEKTQQVFRLSRFDCLTIPEIADRLDLSEKAIEYHLRNALKVVRANLGDFGTVVALFWLSH